MVKSFAGKKEYNQNDPYQLPSLNDKNPLFLASSKLDNIRKIKFNKLRKSVGQNLHDNFLNYTPAYNDIRKYERNTEQAARMIEAL